MLYIGCFTPPDGQGTGIVLADPDEGKVHRVARAPSPSFLTLHPSLPVLYATGPSECHVAVAGDFVVTANYRGGSICAYRLRADGSIGGVTDMVTRDLIHPHMVCPDGNSLLVSDLGRDAVRRFRIENTGKLMAQQMYQVTGGPRHFLRVGSLWYVTCQLDGTLAVFDPDWDLVSRTGGLTTPSELAADAASRFLYVANRGPDTITVFALAKRVPVYVTEVPAGGAWPRHLAVVGDLLHVANQHSHNVTTFHLDPASGIPRLLNSLHTPSPSCVLPARTRAEAAQGGCRVVIPSAGTTKPTPQTGEAP